MAVNNRVDLIGIVVNHPEQAPKTNDQGEEVQATGIVLQIRNELPPIRTRVYVYVVDETDDSGEGSPSGFAAREARFGTVIHVVAEIRPVYTRDEKGVVTGQMLVFNTWQKPDIIAGPFNIAMEDLSKV